MIHYLTYQQSLFATMSNDTVMYGTHNIIRVSASSCVQLFCPDIPNAEEDTASTPYVVTTSFFQLAGFEVVFAKQN